CVLPAVPTRRSSDLVGLVAVEKLRPLVPEGATLAQLALRWILMDEAVSVVIPGAKNSQQALANIAAAGLPPLPASTMEAVQRVRSEEHTSELQSREN